MEEGLAATRGKDKKWTPGTTASVLEVNSSGGERPEAVVEMKKKGGKRRGGGEAEAPPQTRLWGRSFTTSLSSTMSPG